MPKSNIKGRKRLTVRINPLLYKNSRSRQNPPRKSKALSLPLVAVPSSNNSNAVQMVADEDVESDTSESSTPPPGIIPRRRSPSTSPKSVVSSAFSTSMNKWLSKRANDANDQGTRRILSQLTAVVPYSADSVRSQTGRDAVQYEDAHQEALYGLKNSERQDSLSGRKKGKVGFTFLFYFTLLNNFKARAASNSTFKVTSIVFLPYGVIKVCYYLCIP